MKVYIVITTSNDVPKILGVFSTKQQAEHVAYRNRYIWCNVVEKIVDSEV